MTELLVHYHPDRPPMVISDGILQQCMDCGAYTEINKDIEHFVPCPEDKEADNEQ